MEKCISSKIIDIHKTNVKIAIRHFIFQSSVWKNLPPEQGLKILLHIHVVVVLSLANHSPCVIHCEAEPFKPSIYRVIIDSSTTNPFFANRTYFLTYEKYNHEFQSVSEEIFLWYWYGDPILRLTHPDTLEVILTIKKVVDFHRWDEFIWVLFLFQKNG